MALACGRIEVEGVGTFRDAKLFPAALGSGIGARRGRNTRLAFSPPMYASYWTTALRPSCCHKVCWSGWGSVPRRSSCWSGVRVHVLPTQDTADLYDDLRKTEQVAGLFHTTC